MSDIILEADHVSRVFRVRRNWFRPAANLHAVSDVSLSVNKGETLALVGESGSGKTTLSNLLLAIDRPTSGRIMIDGADITKKSRKEIARRIQPVFQDPNDCLNPRQTVAELITMPLVVHRIGTAEERRARMRRMMDLMGLPSRLEDAYPRQLSGGQRQRVAIARALVMEVEIVICDEPTSALDVSVQAQILNLLADIREELGVAFLLISHNLAVVQFLAQRVAIMYLGRIVEEAPSENLFEAPGHPYTRALLGSVLTPDPGAPLPDLAPASVRPNPLELPSGCAFRSQCPLARPICAQCAPDPTPRRDAGWVACHVYADTQ